MAPRNPSELQRLTEELEDLRSKAWDLRLPKSTREVILRQLRTLEKILGVKYQPYNAINPSTLPKS